MAHYNPIPPNGETVNVAAIPDLSPFRYPGGKTWLVPYVRKWIASLEKKPSLFVEPFAGGGIISLTVAAEDLASRVCMVELDRTVASVWQTILSPKDGGMWLARAIRKFQFSELAVRRELRRTGLRGRLLAFQTILRNRVNHGGILARRAGLLKEGERSNGLGSRWYPSTLRNRIFDIIEMRDKIEFVHGDGFEVLKAKRRNSNSVFFLDPPYTQAGSRLYTHSNIDHPELFRQASALTGDFLMTYDDSLEIRRLARAHGFHFRKVAMRSRQHAELTELLIGRDLSWCSRRRQNH
jgi:DNA adenine methylase